MASNALEKSAQLLSRRIVIAESHAQRVFDEFSRRFEHYVFGMPWFETEEQRREFYRKQGEDPEAMRTKRGWDTTTFPLHHMMRSAMLPYMLSGDPVFINEQREGADEKEMAFIDLYNKVAKQAWMEGDTTFEFQRAIDDAYCYRLGWIKTELNTRNRLLPRHRWVNACNMLMDCQTDSPRIEDKRWIAEKMTLPIETAEWFAKNIWDAGKYEFSPVSFEEQESGGHEVRGAGRSREMDAETQDAGDFVRILMVQVKGENPYTMSARFDQKKMNDPAGQDAMYDGQDHVLILEARNGYSSADGYKPIGRMDWVFPCKGGQFTYTPIALTRDNRGPYPYSIMQPGHSSQIAADLGIQAYNTDVRQSARRWFAYDESAFQDPKDARSVIEGDDAGVAIPLKQGRRPSDAVAAGNFGEPSPSTKESFAINRENYEAAQGMNKFDVQVRANQTAYNTGVQNEAAQVRIDSMRQLIQRAITEASEKGVMCARANMTYEDLKHWVNVPETVGEEKTEIVTTARSGKEVVESLLWPDNPDWDDIRREVEVNLEPRSIEYKNPEREANDISEMMKLQLETYRVIGDSVKGGAVDAAQEIARSWNEAVRMICRLKNITNYERILINMEKIAAPVPPPVDPNQVMNAQVQQQGNMMNAQQQAALTRLKQQGVESVPAGMGG